MTEYVSLLDRLTENLTLPEGYDRWGMKTVDALRRTWNAFLWPAVGGEVKSWDSRGIVRPYDACPRSPGDGLTVALDPEQMSSGGLPVHAILTVAYREEDVVGREPWKIRTKGYVRVVGEALLGDLDLRGVHLGRLDAQRVYARYVRLSGSLLHEAKFDYADLCSADLSRADLTGALIHAAELSYADLQGANLSYVDLQGAELYYVDLQGANLSHADLQGANLSHVDLQGAELSHVDLQGANLSYVDLQGAELCGASFPLANMWGARVDGKHQGTGRFSTVQEKQIAWV